MQGKFNVPSVAVALAAGLAIGFAATTLAYRHNLLRLPGEGPLQRMDRVLKLTPAEKAQIGEVMEDTRAKVQEARRKFQQQRRRLLTDAYVRIRDILTPAQQRDFDRDFVPPNFRRGPERQMEEGGAPEPPKGAGPDQPGF